VAVVKRMSSHAKVGKLEKYLKQDEKTEEKLISGMNCDSDNFAKQCELTNTLYDKNQNKNDRKYYHIIQSFSPMDNKKLTLEQAHKIGEQFAQKNFKGFEVLVVTHKDKEHIHNHFVVNSVSLDNGKKYRADNKSLWELRRTSNELCKQNGLVNSIQELGKRAKDKIQSGELRKMVRGEDTWKAELKAQITECASTSKNDTEFKEKMKEKYNVTVTERARTSKGQKETIYEYQPKGNKKPCGEHRLGEEYGKENIRNGFIGRGEEKTRGNDTRVNTEQPSGAITNTTIRDRQIDLNNTDIGIAELKIERAKQDLTRVERERERNREREEQNRARSEKVERGIEPATKKPTHEPRTR